MIFSTARRTHLSRLIAEDLIKEGHVEGSQKELLFETIRRGFFSFEKEWKQLHEEVSYKLKSIKRGIAPGSAEWDTLYQRFFEEAFNKKARVLLKKS